MYRDIFDHHELASLEPDIAELFRASFDAELSSAEWRWFYLENPSGPPCVSLYYDRGQLLGHYAVVPIRLSIQGESRVAYRSMTTMVHPEGRGRGLFTDLALRTYGLLRESGSPLVFGFPNGNSAPGFAKYLGWTISPHDRIVDLTGSELLADDKLLDKLTQDADITWAYDDTAQARWRISRPDTTFIDSPGLTVKMHEGRHNILHLSQQGIAQIGADEAYRVMIPADFHSPQTESAESFAYQFGWRAFSDSLSSMTFRRELVLSDVF